MLLRFENLHLYYFISIILKFATKKMKKMRADIHLKDPATSGTLCPLWAALRLGSV